MSSLTGKGDNMNFIEVFGRMKDGITRRALRVDGDGKLIKSPKTSSSVRTLEILKGGTASTKVDLQDNYRYLLITIPTIDTATLKLQVSLTSGGTYQDLSSATTASGTGAYNTTFNLFGWRHIKIVTSAAQTTATVAFSVQGVTF